MNLPKIAYARQDHVSHARASEDYKEILRERYLVLPQDVAADQLPSIDLVILHVEPFDYGTIYREHPELEKKYVISYCVWEASMLPATYISSLSRVQEVWTCSSYCQSVISQYHGNVHCVPHVVKRDLSCSEEDIEKMKRLVQYQADDFLFLNILGTADKRKNVGDLVKAFDLVASQMPCARLILKAPVNTILPVSSTGRVSYVHGYLSDKEINALYRICHAYISTHHGEGWGLTLSDAMLMGKPALATRYSGNLQFMSEKNSFLIECEERAIAPEDCFGWFSSDMKWAYPNIDDIASKLTFVYSNYFSEQMTNKTNQARLDMENFARVLVSEIIYRRLEKLIT